VGWLDVAPSLFALTKNRKDLQVSQEEKSNPEKNL